MATVLHAFAAVLAPILPHMAEDIWQRLPYDVDEVRLARSPLHSDTSPTGNLPYDVDEVRVALTSLLTFLPCHRYDP